MLPTLPCYPLHRPRPNPELLGDLVQARPIRRSQGGTMRPSSLVSMRGRPQCLPPALGTPMTLEEAGERMGRSHGSHPYPDGGGSERVRSTFPSFNCSFSLSS